MPDPGSPGAADLPGPDRDTGPDPGPERDRDRRVRNLEPDWRPRLESLGSFIRAQRRLAGLTLRQLADLADVSNAYLSQIERGKHEPSVRVLRQVARGLNVSAESILDQAGLFADPEPEPPGDDTANTDVVAAVTADTRLSDAQKDAMLAVYRSYLAANEDTGT